MRREAGTSRGLHRGRAFAAATNSLRAPHNDAPHITSLMGCTAYATAPSTCTSTCCPSTGSSTFDPATPTRAA